MKQFIHFSLSAFLFTYVFSSSSQPVLATRLTADLKTSVAAHFPASKVRLDGAIETRAGELYLPLMPPAPKIPPDKNAKLTLTIRDRFPLSALPDVVVFSNGWCYLRVIEKGDIKTTIGSNALPEKLRKELFACKFVPDLIVPDNFSLSKAMKPLAGDLAIAILPEGGAKTKAPVAQAAPAQPADAQSTSSAVAAANLEPTAVHRDPNIAHVTATDAEPTDTKATDTKATDRKATDRKATDTKATDTKATATQPTSTKAPSTKAPSTKATSTKATATKVTATKVTATPKVGDQPKASEGTGHGAVFICSPHTGKITMLDDKTLEKLIDFPTEGTPAGMTVAAGRLYIADQGKSRILILDPKKRQFLGQIDLTPKSAPKGLASLPNGKLIYASESAAGNIDVIETETGKVLLKTKVLAGPSKVVMAPSGNVIIVLNPPSGQATIIATSNQKVVGVVKVGANPNAVVFSKDSAFAYVSNRVSNSVTIIDVAKHQAVGNLETGAGPTGLAFTSDGEKLLVANAKDNSISVFDVAKRTKLQDVRLPLDVDFPSALFLMPDGEHVLVSSASTEAIGILNVAKLEFERQPVLGHTSDEMLWASLE